MATQTDTAVGGRPFQRLKSVLRGPLRTSVLVTGKDAQRNLSPSSPSDADPPGVPSPDLGVYEAGVSDGLLPPHTSLPLAPAADSSSLPPERLSTSSRDRSRRLSSLGMSKVKALLTSSSSPGVSSPPSPRSRRSTSERTLTELASTGHSRVHLDEDQQSRSEAACDSTILQLLPPEHPDGVYRPGDCLIGTVTLRPSVNGDRRVVSVKSTLQGVRECHLLVPSDDPDPLFRQEATPKRRQIGFSKIAFWTDRCHLFTEIDLATLTAASDASSSAESVSAQFEFLLPKKLPATWQDDYTEDELARPRRLREKSRMPIDLPPSLDASSMALASTSTEETANFLQKASQWVQNTRSDKAKWAKVEYTIEVVVKRQRMGWTGRLGVTKKERLSTPFTVHPHPPFSATVPVAVNPVPAVLPSPRTTDPAARASRASLSVEPLSPPNSGAATARAQRRRSLQVDVGSLTAPNRNREARLPGSPSRDLSDDNLQIITNDRGRQQAWYKHSAVDASGSVFMELSFPALASISTDLKVPFLLRLSLPRGSRPKTDTIRMSLLRTVTSTTRYGILKIETALPMQTPSGQAGVKVEGLTRREDHVRDLPHRLGAEMQIFEGSFILEGYTVPVTRSLNEASATDGLGLLTPASVAPHTSTLVDPSQKTVPSFTFKNLKLSYSLLVQVDIDIPSTSHGAHTFEAGVGQLEIPTICVANDSTSHRASTSGQSMALPRVQVENVQPCDGEATPSGSRPTDGGSAASQPSRLQALPTYSSLYLRDMARRAASESNPLEVQGEGDEDSSTSSEDALEASTDVGHNQERETVAARIPSSSSHAAHHQSSGGASAIPVQGLGAGLAEVRTADARPISPSPSYLSNTAFPFSSLHTSELRGPSAQLRSSSQQPVEAREEDARETTTTTTSAEMANNLSDCTTDTLPPGYHFSVRMALAVNGRSGGSGTSASAGAGASGGGAGGGAGGSGVALTREMRAIEAYLGASGARVAGL